VEEVARDVRAIAAPLVVITGGEPLLQYDSVTELVELITAVGHHMEIETNGTIAPRHMPESVHFNVSPKLANSGLPAERRLRPSVLEAFEATGRARFKFVVRTPEELDEVEVLVRRHGLSDIWISPEGVVADDVIRRSRALVDGVLMRGWSMSSRLHILLWANARGR
jgi:organic radical activating enzyme